MGLQHNGSKSSRKEVDDLPTEAESSERKFKQTGETMLYMGGNAGAQSEGLIKSTVFGKRFEKAVLASLEENPDTLNVYESYGLNRDVLSGSLLRWFAQFDSLRPLVRGLLAICHPLCRWLLYCSRQLTRLDFNHPDYIIGYNFKRRPPLKQRLKFFFSKMFTFRDYKPGDLLLFVFYYLMLDILHNLFYQYKLDGNRLRLRKFRKIMQDESQMNELYSKIGDRMFTFEERTGAEIERIRGRLNTIGAPHSRWSVIAECVYVFIIENGLTIYLLTPILVKVFAIIDLDIVRYMVDLRKQVLNEIELIRIEVNHVIESSKAFTEARIVRIMSLTGHNDRSFLQKDPNLSSLVEKHDHFVRKLKKLALEGKLMPLNRSISACVRGEPMMDDGLNSLVAQYVWHTLASLFFGFALAIHLYTLLPYYFNIAPLKLDTTQDYLFLVKLDIVLFILILTNGTFICLVMTLTYDQTCAVMALKRLIIHCTKSSELQHFKSLSFREANQLDCYQEVEPLDMMVNRYRRKSSMAFLSEQDSRNEPINNGNNSHTSSDGSFFPPLMRRRKTLQLGGFEQGGTNLEPPSRSRKMSTVSVCPELVSTDQLSERLGEQRFRPVSSYSYFVSEDRRQSRASIALASSGLRSRLREDLDQRMESIKELEENLIVAIMHYRLFLAKFKKHRQIWGIFGTIVLFLVTSYPLIIRVHVKYFDKSLKSYAFWISMVSSFPALIALWPICYLNSRCMDIYKVLWSLLARLIAIEANGANEECEYWTKMRSYLSGEDISKLDELMRRRINMELSISILRKELSHSEAFETQFTPRAAGTKVNFSNLLRTLLWLMILILSILTETNTDKQGLLTHLLRDPLGFNTIT